jgi:SAM-dependent methyltransferase
MFEAQSPIEGAGGPADESSRPGMVPRQSFEAIAERERVSDRYWSRKDPIKELRLSWRAETARHIFHLLPGETILELGCGSAGLTQALVHTTRSECPITAATLGCSPDEEVLKTLGPVEVVRLSNLPGELAGRTFDYVVASNLLDLQNSPAILQEVYRLLRPGGRLLFFETNPWNPVFRLRRALGRWLPFLRRGDERELLSQVKLYELLSELGFLRIAATCYDFLYYPIPRWLMLLARNFSLVLENTPGIRQLAGTILLHAQKPPRDLLRPAVRMTEHANLHGAVSVVVPCHNEEMNVAPLVEGLLSHYDEYIHELVLVDDNSKDCTRQVMERLAAREPRVRPVFREPPNGVGRALRDGLRHTRGRYVLLMDCDFLHILPELRDMFDAAARGSEVILGSRFSRESVLINYPLPKILYNRTFHVLASLLFRRRMRDVTNNLKLLKREVVDNLELEAPRFAANAETGLKPLLMGFQEKTIAISWINRTPDMGHSTFSLMKNGSGYSKVLLELVWRTLFGTRRLPRPREQPGPNTKPPPGRKVRGTPAGIEGAATVGDSLFSPVGQTTTLRRVTESVPEGSAVAQRAGSETGAGAPVARKASEGSTG